MPSNANWPRQRRLPELKHYVRIISVCLAILLYLSIAACSDSNHKPVYRNQILAFGTIVELTLFDTSDTDGEKLSNEIRLMMEDFHEHWHAWQNSPLTLLSQTLSQSGQSEINADDAELISKSLALSNASEGLFHPALGELISAWGFHSDELPLSPPSEQTINDILNTLPTLDKITITNNVISNDSGQAIHFDLGGFAKGVIIDRTIEYLRKAGINNAIVNAGGDLRTIGSAGDRPWRIGIRHPRDLAVFASITTRDDESVFTSGDYERYFEYQGKRYHHIIDPRSGYPADTVSSVTVIHRDSATADAAATALFIAGKQDWPRIAKSMGIEQVMIIDKENKVFITPELAERMEYEISPPPAVEIHPLP